jgi:rhomboid protease GluP
MLVVTCPHCRAAVVPQTDGTCPACRRAIPPALAEPFVIQSGYGVSEGGPPGAAGPGSYDPYGSPVAWGESPQQSIARFWHQLLKITPRTLVTPAIVGVNAVIFLLMTLDGGSLFSPRGETLVAWGANFGPLTLDGQWWRLLTCTFVHIGIIHIGLNMWVLWDIGQLVERLTGNVGFLLLYLLSGLFGSLASVYWNPEVLSAGASGAVFGAFGALMGFVLLRGDSIPKSILGPLRNSGTSFLFYNLIFGFSIKGIDMAAHLGGLAAGFACGLILSQPLDRVSSWTRTWRNGVMLVLGSAGLLIAWQAAPAAPVDLQGRLTQFQAVEQKALDTYNGAVQKFQDDQLSQDEFVRVIETQVLPPWRNVREQFEQLDLQRLTPDSRSTIAKHRRYLLLQEQDWTAFAAGLKRQRPAAIGRGQTKERDGQPVGARS